MENKVKDFLSQASNKIPREDKKFLAKVLVAVLVLALVVYVVSLTGAGEPEKKKEIINPALKAQELQIKENKLFQEKLDLDKRIVDFYKDEKKPFIDEVQWMIDGISENKIDTSLLQNIK